VVREVLHDLGLADRERLMVFNKVDRLTHAEEEALRGRVRSLESAPSVFVSALQEPTLEALRETLKARIRARLAYAIVRLPAWDGETLARLYREGEVLSRTDEDGTVRVTVRVPPPVLQGLRERADTNVQEVA